MANASRTYIGDGVQTIYPVSFTLGYIHKSYVFVHLESNPYNFQENYTWVNDTQIELVTPLGSGVRLVITRRVPRETLVNDYTNGAILRGKHLDDSNLQHLMLEEEAADALVLLDYRIGIVEAAGGEGDVIVGGGVSVDDITGLLEAEQVGSVHVAMYYRPLSYQYEAALYLEDASQRHGGGTFVWRADIEKKWHDGGLFIDPEVSFNGAWNGLEYFLAGVGASNIQYAKGVWVRQFTGNPQTTMWGAVGNNIADEHYSIQTGLNTLRTLNDSATIGEGNSGAVNRLQLVGNNRLKTYISIPMNISLYGDKNTISYPQRDSSYANEYNWQNTPVLYADKDIVAASDGSVVKMGEQVLLEHIVVDGYDLDHGTWYPAIRGVSDLGGVASSTAELRVIDPDDVRQDGGLFIESDGILSMELGDDSYVGWQLIVRGGNRSGVGISVDPAITPATPYKWVVVGTLASGFNISSTGWVTCVNPTTAETRYVTIYVYDADGTEKHKDFSLSVNDVIIIPQYPDMCTATVGNAYYEKVEVKNKGIQNLYYWFLDGPEGLVMDKLTGIISGTPALGTQGTYKARVAITYQDHPDFAKCELVNELPYTMECTNTGYPKIFSNTLLETVLNVPYEAYIKVVGGVAPFTWEINLDGEEVERYPNQQAGYPTATHMAAGMSIAVAPNGVDCIVSGTPTTQGGFHFHIKGTDATGYTVGSFILFKGGKPESTLELNIGKANYWPVAVKGQPYSYQLSTNTIGTTMTWGCGNLPSGLVLNEVTGLVTGTPVGANQVHGVSMSWGATIDGCNIRHFKSAAGILMYGPTNVNRISNTFINQCDQGLQCTKVFDGRFESLYIYSCREGVVWKSGTSANTFSNSRIEYIYEAGMVAQYSNENIMYGVYFDTCGHEALIIEDSSDWTMTSNLAYRSCRRAPWRESYILPVVAAEHSNHVKLMDCYNIAFTGNNFTRGSDTSSSKHVFRYKNNGANFVHPKVSMYIENCTGVTIAGNSLAGCTHESLEIVNSDVDIGTNTYQDVNMFQTAVTDGDLAFKNLINNAGKNDFYSDTKLNTFNDQNYALSAICIAGGAIADTSPFATNMGTFGSPTFVTGLFDTAIALDGTADFLQVQVDPNGVNTAPTYFGNGAFSIEMWVRVKTLKACTIIDFGSTSEANTVALSLGPLGHLRVCNNRSTTNEDIDYEARAPLVLNAWTHIRLTRYPNKLAELFVDAVSQVRFKMDKSIVSGWYRPLIGRGGFAGAADYLHGDLEEIRVYKGAAYEKSEYYPLQDRQRTDTALVAGNALYFLPTTTQINSPIANGTYSVKVDTTVKTLLPTIIELRDQSNKDAEQKLGVNGQLSKNTNPSNRYFNVTKAAEVAPSSVYQVNRFDVALVQSGDYKLYNQLRGTRLAISVWVKSAQSNVLRSTLSIYSGSSDNNYAAEGGSTGTLTLTPLWQKVYIPFDFPKFDLVDTDRDECTAAWRLEFDDTGVDYDFDVGGVMLHTVAPLFASTPYQD